jgi:SAM-dependent methyltransferase
MDLSERSEAGCRRHPWETARVKAILQIVGGLGLAAPRVLDVGAGDGYLLGALHAALGFRRAIAQDIHLTESLAREISQPGIEFVRELTDPAYRAELILLLDVLEHVADPAELLSQLTRERLAPGGRLLITVPAFQRLYTEHDRALKHFRRYSRGQVIEQARRAGLSVIQSGYLFASLLLPRAALALGERLLPVRSSTRGNGAHGVGHWQGSARVTRLLHSALVLDNRLCLAASERGLALPGLTVWLTCKAA